MTKHQLLSRSGFSPCSGGPSPRFSIYLIFEPGCRQTPLTVRERLDRLCYKQASWFPISSLSTTFHWHCRLALVIWSHSGSEVCHLESSYSFSMINWDCLCCWGYRFVATVKSRTYLRSLRERKPVGRYQQCLGSFGQDSYFCSTCWYLSLRYLMSSTCWVQDLA